MSENVQYVLSLKDMFTATIRQADGEANKFHGTMGQIQETLLHIGGAVGIAFGVHELVHFGEELLHVNAEFEGFHNVIKYASLGAQDAAANNDYLADAINRLHLPMREAYQQFSELQGGMYGTGIEGNKLRDVFEGISEASLVMHMNADQFSRTVYALKEVGELGTLQTRQMRMLAMALPGAMNLAAESMHMNTHRFHEAMHKGEISAGVFLQNFSAKLKEHFGSGLENASDSLIAKMNDTGNSMIKLQLEMGEQLRPFFISVMQTIIDTINALKGMWEWLMNHQAILKDIKDILIVVSTAWGTYKLIQWGMLAITKLNVLWQAIQYASIVLLGDGMLTASAWTQLWAGSQVLLNAALTANPIGAIIIGIAALVAAVIFAYNHFEKFRAFLWATWAVIKEFGAIVKDLFLGLWHTIHGVFTFNAKEMTLGGKMQLDAIKDSAHRLAEAAKEGWSAGIADFGKDNPSGSLIKPATTKDMKNAPSDKPNMGNNGATSKVSGHKTVNIRIDIKNLINTLAFNTTNMKESTGKVKEEVTKALLSAVNDSQIIAGQ